MSLEEANKLIIQARKEQCFGDDPNAWTDRSWQPVSYPDGPKGDTTSFEELLVNVLEFFQSEHTMALLEDYEDGRAI